MNGFYKEFRDQILTTGLVGLIIAFSCKANAAFNFNVNYSANVSFYGGIGLSYNKELISDSFKNEIRGAATSSKVNSNSLSLSPLLGIQVNNYSLELAYSVHSKLKFIGSRTGHLKLKNYSADIVRFIPIDPYPIDLLLGLGIGRSSIKEHSNVNDPNLLNNYQKFGFRVKGGLQYILDQHINVRALLAYQRVGDRGSKHAVKTLRSLCVDLVYII